MPNKDGSGAIRAFITDLALFMIVAAGCGVSVAESLSADKAYEIMLLGFVTATGAAYALLTRRPPRTWGKGGVDGHGESDQGDMEVNDGL